MKKIKIAIFDLTDCEGCELELINLRGKLALISEQTEIANWRFASNNKDQGPFDITFIEGSPITEDDIAGVKRARAISSLIVSLGTCAALGGVQAMLDKKAWQKGLNEVYGKDYKTNSKPPRPLSYYIDVDLNLPGCPVNQNELARFLASVISNKKPTEARYPVCLECKARENECLLLAGEPCLGPVTKGGCEAVCPSRGLRCWGCFGLLSGGNAPALKTNFEKKFGKEETKQILKTFNSNLDDFRALYPEEDR
jgi:coenzyme F420-reducing hydrogenase gamma subunit